MFHILERRRSVPEEIIRQYNVRKERTSESETNATMPEVTPPSSNDNMWDNPAPSGSEKLRSEVFSQPIEEDFWPIKEMIKERSFKIVDDVIRSAEEGSSDSDSDDPAMERFNTIKRAPLRRSSVIDKSLSTESRNERASQNDYYKNGRGILKINEKSSQTGECTCRSNDSETTPSAQEESESGESSETISSPRVCTHPLSSSENQSSDSEDIKCTCAEITSSKGTSTDPFHSGKSTLSQTVSDKSTSTQDSTASVNSVSSRGSSITAATDSSSTDVDPRTSAKETTTSPDHTPRTPKNNQDNNDRRRDSHRRHCPQHKPQRHSKGGQTEGTYKTEGQNYKANATPRVYEWAQLSQEELNIIQKQLHTKFLENGRNFQSPQPISNNLNVSTRSGSSYQDTEILDDLPLMIPRYSALPRSMSMVVNSSSQDASHYSDSDCQSLADSLEDGNNNCTTYFDTKQESKPVRGDIELALAERTKKTNTKRKEPKGRAYFFSIDNQGEAELVTNIHKIPEPPKTIKNKIHKRHASLSKRIESKEPSEIIKPKFKKPDRPKKENLTPPTVRINDKKLKETETKISTPIEQKPKPSPKIVKTAPSEENQNQEAETPRKPQAVIHPSQQTQSEDVPSTVDMESINHQRQSLINSLESTANVLRAQPKQWQRNQQPVKRVSKFQQRFEVIPEERSSSLTSSAEDPRSEKNRRLSLPVKLTENVNNSTFLNPKSGEKSFRRYTLGSIPKSVISQLMGRPLQAIPCVQRGPNNENQQIIIFSPKDPPGSSKGRDALLAMNREDFNRLSKGWMNFYLLKESSDSDNEVNPDENDQEQEPNTLVCRIPSMEKDPPTTSGSGTDETSISPRRNQQSTKSYSFLLKNLETNCFQLEEVEDSKPNEPISKALSLISEEPEPSDESTYKDASTEIDNTLKKTPKISTKEASTSTERKPKSRPQETSIKLSAPLKLGSSNTVLTTKKAIKVSPRKTPKTSERACSLPELKTETTKKPSPAKTQSMVDPLPRVSGGSPDDSDSDSTIYLNAPSPQVPRLPIEGKFTPFFLKGIISLYPDCCDFYSDSSSSGSTRATNHAPREKAYVPLRRRPLPFRPKNRFVSESVRGKKPGKSEKITQACFKLPSFLGWSVTVEGTLAFPITRPDVQMRLSFPREAGQPFVSQSDSGFVEDREVVSRTVNQKREQWTVTVKNPPSGRENHLLND